MNDTSIQIDRTHFSSIDGRQLFFQSNTSPLAKANILLVHGFGEHCGRYDALAGQLNEAGYNVFRFDLRGHGRSDGKRGHIFEFEEYLQDFACFKERSLSHVNAQTSSFIAAHSYGGLIALSSLLRDPSDICGLALSSPFFGMADGIPRWKIGLGKILSKYVPSLSLPTEIDPNDVSHDPNTVHEYATDTLMGRTASTRWLTETLSAQTRASQQAHVITLPILWQQAGDDRLVSKAAGRALFDSLGSTDKTWSEFSEMFHEIWFEKDRDRPIDELLSWLKKQLL